MDSSFGYISSLQYRLKIAEKKLERFESGEKYIKMNADYKKMRRHYERKIKKLQKELETAHIDNKRNTRNWMDAMDDLVSEQEKEIVHFLKMLNNMEKRALKAEAALDAEKEKSAEWRKKYYETAAELEEQKGINKKLTAQLNRDYTNSSLTTADKRNNKKKISNNRPKTDRKPGAQQGHPHHERKKQSPTEPVKYLLPSEDILNDPDFKPTKKIIIKQRIGLKLILVVEEYRAVVYRNSKTGETVHGKFPAGVVDDVNYDSSVKAFAYLLNNECNVSIDKTRKFISDLTGNQLNISKGMINKLSKEFAEKSKPEQDELFRTLVAAPCLHVDGTLGKVSGKNTAVIVCVTPEGVAMLFSREHKGHESVKDTPVEIYGGVLIHDHDTTYYKYGDRHQECLVHVLRYLKDSMDNEPEREWNKEMHSLIQEMIHARKQLPEGVNFTEEERKKYENRYDRIQKKAEDSYQDVPPSDYYREGYNLYRRLYKYKDSHLLFLSDYNIPYENNAAERIARQFKMKLKQAMNFRSDENISYFCQGKSVLIMMHVNNQNIFESVQEIFNR